MTYKILHINNDRFCLPEEGGGLIDISNTPNGTNIACHIFVKNTEETDASERLRRVALEEKKMNIGDYVEIEFVSIESIREPPAFTLSALPCRKVSIDVDAVEGFEVIIGDDTYNIPFEKGGTSGLTVVTAKEGIIIQLGSMTEDLYSLRYGEHEMNVGDKITVSYKYLNEVSQPFHKEKFHPCSERGED
jgi:hypothetical protein